MRETARHDGFLVDLDGVVWLAREPIGGSIEAIARLREQGPLRFLTNDPRSSREELAQSLTELGAPTAAEEVVTSASATADAIAAEHPGCAVLAVGGSALGEELERRGHGLVEVERGARAKVVGIGGGSDFDYELMRITHEAVREGGELWATNKDPAYPTPEGLVPGTGAFVAAVEYATGRRARCVGKPHPEIFAAAAGELGAERPLMIGDSLDSDIAGAAAASVSTALVLSGRTDRTALEAAEVAPDHVHENLAAAAADLA